MKIESILNAKGNQVHTVKSGDTISEAVAALNQHNIGALVVLNGNDAIAGILSERDIVRNLGKPDVRTGSARVSECMTPNPVTGTPDQTIDEVMQVMTNRRIRHLPIEQNGSLVGVISIGDVVKRKIELAEHEAESLREYIAS